MRGPKHTFLEWPCSLCRGGSPSTEVKYISFWLTGKNTLEKKKIKKKCFLDVGFEYREGQKCSELCNHWAGDAQSVTASYQHLQAVPEQAGPPRQGHSSVLEDTDAWQHFRVFGLPGGVGFPLSGGTGMCLTSFLSIPLVNIGAKQNSMEEQPLMNHPFPIPSPYASLPSQVWHQLCVWCLCTGH